MLKLLSISTLLQLKEMELPKAYMASTRYKNERCIDIIPGACRGNENLYAFEGRHEAGTLKTTNPS